MWKKHVTPGSIDGWLHLVPRGQWCNLRTPTWGGLWGARHLVGKCFWVRSWVMLNLRFNRSAWTCLRFGWKPSKKMVSWIVWCHFSSAEKSASLSDSVVKVASSSSPEHCGKQRGCFQTTQIFHILAYSCWSGILTNSKLGIFKKYLAIHDRSSCTIDNS